MSWYRTGTIALVNGSAAVTGTGTAWIQAAAPGEGLLAPDGKVYEIASVNSDVGMTLGSPYLGATVSAQSYTIVPTQSYIRDLANQAAALVNAYQGVKDGAGAGKFQDGTAAAPGIAFAADPNTGMRRTGPDALALTTGGVDRVAIGPSGAQVLGDFSTSGGHYNVAVTQFKIGTNTNYVPISRAGDSAIIGNGQYVPLVIGAHDGGSARFSQTTTQLVAPNGKGFELFSNGNTVSSNRLVADGATGNDYLNSSLETRGGGTVAPANKPILGFHQPGSFAGLIRQENQSMFGFYQAGGVNTADLTVRSLTARGRVLALADGQAVYSAAGSQLLLNLESVSGLYSAGLIVVKGNENGINQTIAVYSYNLSFYAYGVNDRHVQLKLLHRSQLNNDYGNPFLHLGNYAGADRRLDQQTQVNNLGSCSDVYVANGVDAGFSVNYSLIRIV